MKGEVAASKSDAEILKWCAEFMNMQEQNCTDEPNPRLKQRQQPIPRERYVDDAAAAKEYIERKRILELFQVYQSVVQINALGLVSSSNNGAMDFKDRTSINL